MICDQSCTSKFLLISKAITTTFAILATILVLRLSIKHAKNYTNPLFQNKIIVIIFIIPFYALNAMFATLFVNTEYMSEIFSVLRAMYEAFLIISFFQLIVAYLCFIEGEGVHIERMYECLEEKGMMMWTIPISWVFPHVEVKT